MKNPFNKKTHPNCHEGFEYALGVINKNITACIYNIKSCERFISDYQRSIDDFDCPFYFDVDKAEKYLKLVQRFEHVEGHWPNKFIVYEPWQKFIFMNLKGFMRKDTGMIRFRTGHIEISRGNSKSTMASQAALYDMCLDNPNGNHVYCAATKREQARIVLDSARAMANKNSDFTKKVGVSVMAHHIEHSKSNSYVKSVSSDSSSLDGLKGKLIICDELHAMKRETFETLDSGQSKRRDSLLLCITTAGYDTSGVGHSQSAYAKKVVMGDIKDETFFSIIFTIDEGDDYFDESSWKKANPGFGTIVDPVNFEAKALKAKENPADLNGFLIKHLNVWTNSSSPFFDLAKWDACADPTIKIEQFIGKKVYVGIDLASKIDLTSFVYIFKEGEKYYIFDRSFIPAGTIENSNNDFYREWVDKGHLIATNGEAINYPKLQEEFLTNSKQYRIAEAMFDPWNATEFATRMSMDRVEMVEFKMNTSNLSEPMKKLDALIREGNIVHSGSPLLRWCLGNVVAKMDHNDNVFPRKEHENNKIDPIVAMIMGIAGWISEDSSTSIYEDRGIRFL